RPDSPDLNPIERVFSKLKARTFDALFQSVAQTRELFPPQERQNLFKAAGYVAD
ncbi:MAG: IS630 family transposase, partial [Pseudomonadota bacterium]